MKFNDEEMQSTLALLERLRVELPEIWNQAHVVGKWVWLEFNVPPLSDIRFKLKQLGFHWNGGRKCWQHPCGESRPRAFVDPRLIYQTVAARAFRINETMPKRQEIAASEYKVISLRECPLPEEMLVCNTPEVAAQYWRLHIATNPYFNPDCECFAIILLNTQRRIKGHQLVSQGTMDTVLVHSREVFRCAVIAGAHAIVLMHNHPSGEAEPSEPDIRATRDLIRAGQLMKIEVLDHVIIGNQRHRSLRELGFFL